jgi:hypothetical protein
MKTIWKFTLMPDLSHDYLIGVPMPRGAVVLSVGNQMEEICLWAEVDTEATKEERAFEVHGTGHQMHQDMGVSRKYIGTVMLRGGSLVFHVYEWMGV